MPISIYLYWTPLAFHDFNDSDNCCTITMAVFSVYRDSGREYLVNRDIGVIVITTTQLSSTRPELMFCLRFVGDFQ